MVAGLNTTQNKIIVIAGDSWACGEWFNDPTTGYGISHLGLSKYLTDAGYLVINLSQPGGSNIITATRVDDFLKLSTYLNIAHVFVFQTEWTRDMRGKGKDMVCRDVARGYIELKTKLISKFYQNLSCVAEQTKVPIHLIGGCSDTIWLDNFAKEYPGLNVVCQSLTNLLLTDNHRIANPVYAIITNQDEKQIDYLKEAMNSSDLELLLDDIDQGRQRLSQWDQEKSFFWPDGGHANQKSHAILFEFLKNQIPDL